MSRFTSRVAIATLFGATACGGGDISELTPAETTSETEDIAADESVSAAEVVFEDHYSEGGTFTIYETDAGLAVSLTGAIGQDDEAMAGRMLASGTLVDTYLGLHPERAGAPDALVALSERFERQLAEAPAREANAEATHGAPQEKSLSSFMSNVCVTHYVPPSFKYVPEHCEYQYNWHAICGWATVDAYDWVFGWNESAYGSTTRLHNSSTGAVVGNPGYLNAWTWGYFWWGGTFSNYYACMTLDGSGTGGNLGISHHDRIWIIR